MDRRFRSGMDVMSWLEETDVEYRRSGNSKEDSIERVLECGPFQVLRGGKIDDFLRGLDELQRQFIESASPEVLREAARHRDAIPKPEAVLCAPDANAFPFPVFIEYFSATMPAADTPESGCSEEDCRGILRQICRSLNRDGVALRFNGREDLCDKLHPALVALHRMQHEPSRKSLQKYGASFLGSAQWFADSISYEMAGEPREQLGRIAFDCYDLDEYTLHFSYQARKDMKAECLCPEKRALFEELRKEFEAAKWLLDELGRFEEEHARTGLDKYRMQKSLVKYDRNIFMEQALYPFIGYAEYSLPLRN